ncbi:DM DNA binding domain protein [Teladorsagia circumcincta]|uniref:DM DNA binding domain protein n=1 Tax=Teladorsagia circumcincta TaxID=45464 RepID=A0A2G9TZ80_TELCI|nr:DM DNA binding domain protein [Teladorsagia circumcincta]
MKLEEVDPFLVGKSPWGGERRETATRTKTAGDVRRVGRGHVVGGTGRGERVPNCQKCGQHGQKSRLKGHKRLCPFKDCLCAKGSQTRLKQFRAFET